MDQTTGRHVLTLGDVQETMLIPLFARAVETRKRSPILRDPAAVRMVGAIDYDFARFGTSVNAMATLLSLRSAMFDEWVRSFLLRYPAGTVVEIGAGLSTRYERLDNGMASWVDVDLPDAIDVRRMFLPEEDRKWTVASSVLDPAWVAEVASRPGPYLFVSEGVFVYLLPSDVRHALGLITANFAGARLIFDTYGERIVQEGRRRGPVAGTRAKLAWACDDPQDIEHWGLGLRLLDSRTFANPQLRIRRRLRWRMRAALPAAATWLPRGLNSSRVNFFQHDVAA